MTLNGVNRNHFNDKQGNWEDYQSTNLFTISWHNITIFELFSKGLSIYFTVYHILVIWQGTVLLDNFWDM